MNRGGYNPYLQPNLPIDLTYAEIRELLLAQAKARKRSAKPLVIDRIWAVAADESDEANKKEQERLERIAKLNRMELGDLGERAFEMMAGEHRLAMAVPRNAALPLDVVTIARRKGYPVWKIQVRCVAYRAHQTYQVSLRKAHSKLKSGGEPYEPGDFDFFAVWIVPEDEWYIIPFEKLPMKMTAIKLHPRAKSKKELGQLDQFKDRWDLLE